VSWLRTARRSLDAEADHTALDHLRATQLVVGRTPDAVAMLAEQTGRGRPARVQGTRQLVVKRTRDAVPYRVLGEIVEVLRVFHISRSSRTPRSSSLMRRCSAVTRGAFRHQHVNL
jgi:plasmid stabilization system protein ParE